MEILIAPTGNATFQYGNGITPYFTTDLVLGGIVSLGKGGRVPSAWVERRKFCRDRFRKNSRTLGNLIFYKLL
jgi:hypothetical protein